MKNLADIAEQDVLDFLRTNQELLFNERDFQMHLATHLRQTKHYDDVDVEYYVPCDALENYIWNSELRLDILVQKNEEYLPIELKYKTKRAEKNVLRFGENIEKIQVLKNQGAQDLGMYDFWKDVRRIELVRNRFKNVHNGLAVFLTNDSLYTTLTRNTSNNFLLNMAEGKHGKEKHWQKPETACAKTHLDFEVEKEYSIHWDTKQIEDVDFYYCIVTI